MLQGTQKCALQPIFASDASISTAFSQNLLMLYMYVQATLLCRINEAMAGMTTNKGKLVPR